VKKVFARVRVRMRLARSKLIVRRIDRVTLVTRFQRMIQVTQTILRGVAMMIDESEER